MSSNHKTLSLFCLLLLLRCGDVESNPGPPRRSIAGNKPSAEEKIDALGNSLTQYEAKISGLEDELDQQKKKYDEKFEGLDVKLVSLTTDLAAIKEGNGEGVDTMKAALEEKLLEAEKKVEEVAEVFQEFTKRYDDESTETSTRVSGVEAAVSEFKQSADGDLSGIKRDSEEIKSNFLEVEQKVKDIKIESSGKLQSLATATRDQRREYKSKFVDLDAEFTRMRDRMELINQILDEMHEKMYEFEQNKKNNLIFYGVRNRPHENSDSLKTFMMGILRDHLHIRREIPVVRANRMLTGPEVRGCRPVLIAFETFKDREVVLRQSKVLKRANIDVTEDFSRKTRETRVELRKFMRKVKRMNPEKNCFLEYDKLYIDHKIFVYNDGLGQVVEQSEAQRYGDLINYSRPGTQMQMLHPGSTLPNSFSMDERLLGPSRPPSGMSTHGGSGRPVGPSRPASGLNRTDSGLDFGRQLDRGKSASAIPRLPPLSRALSVSTGHVQQMDPRDEKLDEMERMVASYQEKLDSVNHAYQEKVSILETKLVDREMEKGVVTIAPPINGNNGNNNGYHNSHGNEYSDFETDAEDSRPSSPMGSPLKQVVQQQVQQQQQQQGGQQYMAPPSPVKAVSVPRQATIQEEDSVSNAEESVNGRAEEPEKEEEKLKVEVEAQ